MSNDVLLQAKNNAGYEQSGWLASLINSKPGVRIPPPLQSEVLRYKVSIYSFKDALVESCSIDLAFKIIEYVQYSIRKRVISGGYE